MMESLQPKQLGARSVVFTEGAQWVRADFHLHTRADREFKYTGEDNFYNSNYVDALEKAGIRLGDVGAMAGGRSVDDLEYRRDEPTTNRGAVENVAGRDLRRCRSGGCDGSSHRLPVAGATTGQIDESLGPFVVRRAQGDASSTCCKHVVKASSGHRQLPSIYSVTSRPELGSRCRRNPESPPFAGRWSRSGKLHETLPVSAAAGRSGSG